MEQKNSEEIRDAVKKVYAGVVSKGGSCSGSTGTSCCGTGPQKKAPLRNGYSELDHSQAPEGADLGLGCGNPLAFAGVQDGQTVLDLGSGAGFDCFIASKKVGDKGRVIGLDMTGEMVAKARKLAEENGYENVEFRLGRIEDMPIEDSSVDWVISNCVVNLSPEKDRVFSEAFRVLKPGGRILISDVVVENMPEAWKDNISAWAACVAGAVSETRYLDIIANAGFEDVEIRERTEFFSVSDPEPVSVSSIRVSAVKPVAPEERKRGSEKKKKNQELDNETQLLISAGAAVAAGCIPCLQTIVAMARDAGIEDWKLKIAVKTGQFVKDKPIEMMKSCADDLLGTHLQTKAGKESMTCPGLPTREDEDEGHEKTPSCGCGQPTQNAVHGGQQGCCTGQA